MELCVQKTGVALGDAVAAIMDRAAGKSRPTGQKVHAGTKTMRGREGVFWGRTDRRFAAAVMRVAEKVERDAMREHRRAGNRRRNGPLGGVVGLNVLRYLLTKVNRVTGQLDPALATIADAVGHSVAGVHAALARLAAAGFVQWLRRYVETGERGIRGPQVKQTSNAYRITIPKAYASMVKAPPLPDDDSHRRQLAAEEHGGMIAALPLDEQPAAIGAEGELAETLARLARGIMERDSKAPNESDPKV